MKEEINKAKDDGIEAIICLDGHVKDWVDKKIIEDKSINRIYLPTPSEQGIRWWHNLNKKDAIKKTSKS